MTKPDPIIFLDEDVAPLIEVMVEEYRKVKSENIDLRRENVKLKQQKENLEAIILELVAARGEEEAGDNESIGKREDST